MNKKALDRHEWWLGECGYKAKENKMKVSMSLKKWSTKKGVSSLEHSYHITALSNQDLVADAIIQLIEKHSNEVNKSNEISISVAMAR